MLNSSFSFLLWMEIGFFSLLFYLCMKIGWFYLHSQNEERSKPTGAFPPEQTPPAFHTPLWQLNPLEWHNYPVSELTKTALRSIFQFQAYFMNPANVFLLPAPLWLVDRDYITLQIWLHATPFQAKQSKSTEMKSLLTSMEISLLLLFFSRELLDCSCSNLHIKVK